MKKILVSLAGQTPQVVTETIYYYSVTAEPTVRFDELYIITTTAGAATVRKELMDEKEGKLKQLSEEYDIRIPTPQIEIITRPEQAENVPLKDIRTPADNQHLAHFLFNFFKLITANKEHIIYFTLAGGRKTMSSFGMFILSLFGNERDTLSHVLVNPQAAESSPTFFFPPKKSIPILDRDKNVVHKSDGSPLETKDVSIDLAELPYIRMRKLFERKEFDVGPKDYLMLRKEIQEEIDLEQLIINYKTKIVYVGATQIMYETDTGKKHPLAPRMFVLYSFFIEQAFNKPQESADFSERKVKTIYTSTTKNEISTEFKEALKEHAMNKMKYDSISPMVTRTLDNLSKQNLASSLSKISAGFKVALNQSYIYEKYIIKFDDINARKNKPHIEHWVEVPKSKITIITLDGETLKGA